MVIQKISKLLGMLITQIENWNISIAKLRKVHSLQIFMGVYVFDILQCLHKCLHSFHLCCFRVFLELLVFTAFRNSSWNIFFTEHAPMQILETDKCKWHISCSPPLSMPQNKNNELLVFCPDIMTHKRQYHIMSMSYGNRQTINYSSYKLSWRSCQCKI